jgi:MFS transporter, putative metabolite:H+ symporter
VKTKPGVWLAVLVAALGYFVDIYDLILFSVVRTPSLKALGVAPDQLLPVGLDVLGWQTTGMLLGGFLWGMLGDRRGRLSVLFGSILLYSLANIANGFVSSVNEYKLLRFIAGVGLAGELGAGITLVSELVEKRLRGYATTIVAGVGICGALVAVTVSKLTSWQNAYFIGGGMGLALLLLRISVAESGMFAAVREQKHVVRGSFFALFADRRRALRYVAIVVVGVPIWFVVAILAASSPEIGTAMGMAVPPTAPDAIFWLYVGLAVGDFGSGALSQLLGSRKQALGVFLGITAIGMIYYFTLARQSPTMFYVGCAILGLGTGYWAVFVTVAAEQFGTNLRATAATTAPNFVRGSVDLSKWAFLALAPGVGLVKAAMIVGAVELGLACVMLFFLEETHGKDLDYVEQIQ